MFENYNQSSHLHLLRDGTDGQTEVEGPIGENKLTTQEAVIGLVYSVHLMSEIVRNSSASHGDLGGIPSLLSAFFAKKKIHQP